MPRSFGLRARTRNLFARPFRKHGQVPLSTYLTTFHVGDYVDIIANSSIHKGMPYKFYHGRTGRVFTVTPRGLGVEVNKQVRNRIIKKRIYVRIEHVRKSRCLEQTRKLQRMNAEIAKWNRENPNDKKPKVKITPEGPKPGHTVRVKDVNIELVEPIPYELNA